VSAIVSFVLSLTEVQTKLGNYVSKELKESLDVDIRVKRIDLSYLGQIKLNEILIEDHHQDTLIFVGSLRTSLLSVKEIFENNVELGKVALSDGVFNLKTYEKELKSNLLIFQQKLVKNKEKKKKPFSLESRYIRTNGIDFRIYNENSSKKPLIASYLNIHGDLFDFKLDGPNVSANLEKVRFIDNHNIDVTNLTTSFSYTPSKMLFNNTVLETRESFLKTEMSFTYNVEDLKNFNEKVIIEADILPSYFSLNDLRKIYKEFGVNDTIDFTSKFKGSLNDFKLTNLKLESKKDLVIRGDYHFKNSVNNREDFSMNASVERVSSNYSELKDLLPNLLGKHLPSELKKVGEFNINGVLDITRDTIKSNVVIDSEIGRIDTDMVLGNISKIDEASYKGHLNVENFKLGIIVGDPLIGEVSLIGDVNGKGFTVENINTQIKGEITKHQYKGYSYENINVDGVFRNKLFNGHLIVDDENLKMDFKGLADFSSEISKFDFNAKVDYANFNKLNLFNRDSIAVLKGDISMDFEGNTIDDIHGVANFKNSSYRNQNDTYLFKDFTIKSETNKEVKHIVVSSEDIVNGEIKGDFRITQIDKLIRNSLGSMLSNYTPLEVRENQYFDFDFQIYNEIVEVFLPQVKLAPNTILKGKVVDSNNEIKMLLQAPKLGVYHTILDSVHLQIDNKNPILNTNFRIKKIQTENYVLNNFNLLNKTLNDTLFFRADFTGGKENKERYDLSLFYTYDKNKKSILGVEQSKIHFKGRDWFVNENNNPLNKVIFDLEKEIYQFEEFSFSSEEQEIKFNGTVRDSTYKDLQISFDKVDLDDITPKIDSLSLDGILNGDLNFKQDKGVYQPFGKVTVQDFTVNNAKQGDLSMQLQAEDSYKKYNLDLELISNSYKNLSANGFIDLTPEKAIIDLDVKLDEFKLNAFSPLGKNVLSRIRGVAGGDFKVSGELRNPSIDGEIALTNTGLTFPYLNIDLDFIENPKIKLQKQSFVFEGVKLKDSKYNTTGQLFGTINHQAFKNWSLNLAISSDRLLILDTKDKEGGNYYGTGFISGIANIKGATNDLRIDVKAKTLAGTKFIIPLNDVTAVENSSLIHFKKEVKKNEIKLFDNKEYLLDNIQGLSLNFDIDVTKEAEAQIVIDRISGSSLKGTGTGNFLIEIDTKGKFNMFGDYLIDKGVYNFIYGGVINKPFEINKGGVISWDGDPFDALLNIEAVHRVKANPKALLENLNTNRKIEIDLLTKIRGKLFNSTNEFDILIPNSSSLVSSELNFKLNDNDDNTKMRQFFSLLISKSFFNETNIGANGSSAITGTTSDIISGALSDIFNKEGDKFQIDLGYTAGEKDDIETQNIDDQVDISLATQINDKILINGKLGVPVGAKTQSSVVGEVKVEILVDDEGNLRWTFFNRQNEIQYSEEEEGYTQGIGLTYRIDFDNLKEMLVKLGLKKGKLKKDDIERAKLEEDFILDVPAIF
jgi:hypothetical protein